MKTQKLHPNYIDLFPYEDCKKAFDAFYTFDCGLSPVCLSAPSQKYSVCRKVFKEDTSSNIHLNIKTLKLEYAMRVWIKATLISQINPGPLIYYWWLHYEANETSFRELRYSNFYCDTTPEEQVAMFWKLLEDVANSGSITVSEGYSFTSGKGFTSGPKLSVNVILNVEDAMQGENAIKDIFEYQYDYTCRTFKWEDIKDMFTQLTLKQLSLYDLSKLHKSSEIDKMLFAACRKMDVEAVKDAIRLGADVNSLNDQGESPLQLAVEYFTNHDIVIDKQYSEEQLAEIGRNNYRKCVEVVDYLIAQGADLDLFGVDGMQPLLCAYYARSLEMVRHLLEKGSNPNYNSYRCDILSHNDKEITRSTILEVISDCSSDEYGEFEQEVEDLVHKYGGKLYDWDMDVARESNIGRYYVSMDVCSSDYIFFDNEGCGIGTEKFLTVLNADGIKTEISMTAIDGLKEWRDDYHRNRENHLYNWDEWNKRGIAIAHNVAKVLPEHVALFYPFGDKIECKFDTFHKIHYLKRLYEERRICALE
ncbi:MAG: hypothetical protein HUK14_09635 [Muribaculaceae bacterium]|nr:hypothetical protein [Muribaculaceae bacterium]